MWRRSAHRLLFLSPNWVTIVNIFILKSSVTSIKHSESIWIVNSYKIYQLKLIYVLFVFVYRDDEQYSEIMLSLWNEFEEIKKEIPNRHSSTKNYLHSQCAVKCLYNCPIIILIPNFLLISYVFFFFSFFLFWMVFLSFWVSFSGRRIPITLPNTGALARKRNSFYLRAILVICLVLFAILQLHLINSRK